MAIERRRPFGTTLRSEITGFPNFAVLKVAIVPE